VKVSGCTERVGRDNMDGNSKMSLKIGEGSEKYKERKVRSGWEGDSEREARAWRKCQRRRGRRDRRARVMEPSTAAKQTRVYKEGTQLKR